MVEWLINALNYCLHLNIHLATLTEHYGAWVYGIMFAVVFAETGFVVTPFLPGDSLLFAAGAVAATAGGLDPWAVCLVLTIAAVAGDAANYSIGHYLGPKVFSRPKSWFFNPEHLNQAHRFYEKYGGKTIIIARFVPIIRTFAPFVAGIGSMTYRRFAIYNVTGALLWVLGVTWVGYWFGSLDWVKKNFGAVILAIIIISILPGVIEFIREWRRRKKGRNGTAQGGAPTNAPPA
jgi:membrane-associated protein